jgi:hypothetical protein
MQLDGNPMKTAEENYLLITEASVGKVSFFVVGKLFR